MMELSKISWNDPPKMVHRSTQEVIVTNDKIIGVVVDNRNGNSAETSVFKIHYANDGIHIVPDYPSKKR